MLGFYLSDRPAPLALFFFAAAVTVFCGIVHSVRYAARKDTVTGLDNGNSFIRASASLPLKYGLGIVCIDDYKHLAQIFKKSGIDEIVVMVAKNPRTGTGNSDLPLRCRRIYRHLSGCRKGTSFARVDNIRRSVGRLRIFIKRPQKKA